MMTRDYELIDSIEMIEKAIQRMDIAENGTPYILDWSHATQGNASATDEVSLVCYCKDLKDFQIFESIVMRSDLIAGVTLPSFCIGKSVEVWAFLNTEKRTFASNSFYLGEHTVL